MGRIPPWPSIVYNWYYPGGNNSGIRWPSIEWYYPSGPLCWSSIKWCPHVPPIAPLSFGPLCLVCSVMFFWGCAGPRTPAHVILVALFRRWPQVVKSDGQHEPSPATGVDWFCFFWSVRWFWHVLACFGLFGVFRVVFEISRLWTSMGGLSLSGDSSGMQWLLTCEGFLMGCLGFHFIVEIWGF